MSIALVTGAGRGIGAATARLLAQKGMKVVLLAKSRNQIEDVAAEINKKGGQAFAVGGDVSDEATVKKLFDQVEKKWGLIEVLVNNAAIVGLGEFENYKTQEWDRVMAVNLRGSFLCAREAFSHMKKAGRGAIVNLSSLGGIQGTDKFAGLTPYSVSKFGMIGLTECLAVEGKPYHIRVNAVAPGAVDTQMLREAAPFLKTSTTPEDIAKEIYQLIDERQSSGVTGKTIVIDSNE